ncbi:hypothetical protein TNCV_750091 [Trichonephila clavipes]|nr:hypothetical protein TNCV_750091 [Trichonephila clavipes]
MAHVDTLSRPRHCMLIQNSVHLQFIKAEQADDQNNSDKDASRNNATCIFTWVYPTTSMDAAEAINRLENQRHFFENPDRIITDKGSTFTSSAFEDYCNKQNILHISITTGLPRSNGQIEKQNSTIIAALSKLSVDDPKKWYSHVPHLLEILNSTFQRSIKTTPFELLFGTKIKSCQDIEIVQLLNDEVTAQFQEQRGALRQDAKKQRSK